MKNLILLFLALFIAGPFYGQRVKEQDMTMSLGSKYAYYVEVNDYNKKDTEKAWQEYVKTYGKSKYNKKAKEYYLNGAQIPIINGTKTVDVYTKIDEGKDQSTVYSWVDLGGAFANPKDHAAAAEGIRTFMNDFWIFARKKAVTQELENEEKKQKDLEKDLAKLEKKNADLHNDIEKLKEKIRQAEADIEQNLKDQDDNKVATMQQKKVVEKTVDRLNNIGKESY